MAPYFAAKDFQAAFVSLDKEPAKAAAWLVHELRGGEELARRMFVDAEFVAADRLRLDAFPTTLVVGRDGRVVHVQRGFKPGVASTQRTVKMVTELLRVK